MNNNRCNYIDQNDQLIKLGLEQLAADIHVPDVSLAYAQYKQQTKRQMRYKTAVTAATAVLLFIYVTPGLAVAFRGLSISISQMISRTSKLYQRTGADSPQVDVGQFQQKRFTKLGDLKKEKDVLGLIPNSLESEQFISAEITYGKPGKISKLSMELAANGTSLYYACNDINTSGRVIDVEDFTPEEGTINGRAFTVYSDQDFSLLEWTNNFYLFEVYGNMQAEELIETAIQLGFF